jgi:ribosomal protein L44E
MVCIFLESIYPVSSRGWGVRVERRFCDHCLMRTEHEVIKEPEMPTRKAKVKYRCKVCGRERWLTPLRPSSEISY